MTLQALHQIQIFHQRDRGQPTGSVQQQARQQQALVAVGQLAPPAAQGHRPFHQTQSGMTAVDRQVEIPGSLRQGKGRNHSSAPARSEAGIGMQQHQPGAAAACDPPGQLQATAGGVGQHPRPGQGCHPDGGVGTSTIHHQYLRHQLRRGGQIGQQQWQPGCLVTGRDHDRDRWSHWHRWRAHRQSPRSPTRSRSPRQDNITGSRPRCAMAAKVCSRTRAVPQAMPPISQGSGWRRPTSQ